MRSMVERMSVTASAVTGMPSRNLPIKVSAACVSVSSRGQPEKAASAFDGVNETKNIAEDAAVIRLLLETHELGVDEIEALAGLSEKVAQQLVHSRRLVAAGEPPATRRACIPLPAAHDARRPRQARYA